MKLCIYVLIQEPFAKKKLLKNFARTPPPFPYLQSLSSDAILAQKNKFPSHQIPSNLLNITEMSLQHRRKAKMNERQRRIFHHFIFLSWQPNESSEFFLHSFYWHCSGRRNISPYRSSLGNRTCVFHWQATWLFIWGTSPQSVLFFFFWGGGDTAGTVLFAVAKPENGTKWLLFPGLWVVLSWINLSGLPTRCTDLGRKNGTVNKNNKEETVLRIREKCFRTKIYRLNFLCIRDERGCRWWSIGLFTHTNRALYLKFTCSQMQLLSRSGGRLACKCCGTFFLLSNASLFTSLMRAYLSNWRIICSCLFFFCLNVHEIRRA